MDPSPPSVTPGVPLPWQKKLKFYLQLLTVASINLAILVSFGLQYWKHFVLINIFDFVNCRLCVEVQYQHLRSLAWVAGIIAILGTLFTFGYYFGFLWNLDFHFWFFITISGTNFDHWQEVLYSVVLIDYLLIFVTIFLKSLVALAPEAWLCYHIKAKVYNFLEHFSQLYRSLQPIQSWLLYILTAFPVPADAFLFHGLPICWTTVLLTFYLYPKLLYIFFHQTGLQDAFYSFYLIFTEITTVITVVPFTEQDERESEGKECVICFEVLANPVKLKCGHIFCSECARAWFQRQPAGVKTCPVCRTDVEGESKGNTKYQCGCTSSVRCPL